MDQPQTFVIGSQIQAITNPQQQISQNPRQQQFSQQYQRLQSFHQKQNQSNPQPQYQHSTSHTYTNPHYQSNQPNYANSTHYPQQTPYYQNQTVAPYHQPSQAQSNSNHYHPQYAPFYYQNNPYPHDQSHNQNRIPQPSPTYQSQAYPQNYGYPQNQINQNKQTQNKIQNQNNAQKQSNTTSPQKHGGGSQQQKGSSEKKQPSKMTPDQYWLKDLKEHPEDESALVSGHLNMILSQSSHKFGSSITDFLSQIKNSRTLQKIKKEPEDNGAFEEVTKGMIHSFICHLIEQIDTYYGNLYENNISPRFYALARAVIEERIWNSLYGEIFPLFEQRNQEDDRWYVKQTNLFRTLIPAHLGVKQLFWLLPDSEDPVPPYQSAISLLVSLVSVKTPTGKIKVLAKVAKEIVACVKRCWKGQVPDNQLDIGADDLVPLMSYVILKSNISNLGSQASFMETFIDDQSAIEEGGYMIATFQTCLSYISCLSKEEVETSATEMYQKAERKQFQITDSNPTHQTDETFPHEDPENQPQEPKEDLIEW